MPTMPVSPATEAEVAQRFPHATNDELALAYKLTRRQVQHIGSRHGLTKTAETVSRARRAPRAEPANNLMGRLAAAIVAASATGLTRAAATLVEPDARPEQIDGALYKLTADGRAHRGGRKGASRWFATKAHAAAFTQLASASAPAQARKQATPAGVRIAPSAGPAQQQGALHITEHTRRMVAAPVPGPEARWHTNAQPVFSANRPGQYLDAAPRSWVAAITGSKQP